MKRTPEDEIKRLKAGLQIAIQGLKDLSMPCTRMDYSVGKLDEVTCRIATDRLNQTITALRG